jgi:hypothetical protein
MNIFILHKNFKINASMMCDSHIRKMGVEAAQMLTIAVAYAQGQIADTVDPHGQRRYWKWCDQPYVNMYRITKSQASHPCSVWVRTSIDNAIWTCDYTDAILDEYEFRFDSENAARRIVNLARSVFETRAWAELSMPKLGKPTKHAQCIPTRYQDRSVVKAYRAYYAGEKQHLLTYTRRRRPSWLRDI